MRCMLSRMVARLAPEGTVPLCALENLPYVP